MKEDTNSILDQAEQYLETNKELFTLKLTDKIATVVSTLVSQLAIVILAFIGMFMLMMGFSFWLGDLLGNNYAGFLIIGGVCGIATWIVYLKRYTMIKKPIMDTIVSEILN